MVKLERGKDISFLEVNVELPGPDVKLIRTPKPTEPAAADKPAEKVDEPAAEKAADAKPAEKTAEKPVEKPAEKAAEKVASEKVSDGKPLAGGPGLATA